MATPDASGGAVSPRDYGEGADHAPGLSNGRSGPDIVEATSRNTTEGEEDADAELFVQDATQTKRPLVHPSPFAERGFQGDDGEGGGTSDTEMETPRGGLERNISVTRAVSWQDMHGRELVTVREFEPSEHGGDEPEEPKVHRPCCSIM